MANKYRQKPVKNTKKETANPLKTTSKRLIQKTAEPTSDLVGHKNAEKLQRLHQRVTVRDPRKFLQPNEMPKDIYTPPEKREQLMDELLLLQL